MAVARVGARFILEVGMAGKSLRVLALVCGLMLPAVQVQAGNEPDSFMAEAFSREEPLSQKDIDAYLEAFPHLKEKTGQDQVGAVFEKAGISRERGIYVVVRIGQAYAVLEFEKELGAEAAESYRDSLDDPFKPTADEVNLVRQNKARVDEVMAAW